MEEKTSIPSPPSFQISTIQLSSDTIRSANPPLGQDGAEEPRLTSRSPGANLQEKDVSISSSNANKKQCTAGSVKTHHTVTKTANDLSNTLLDLRNKNKNRALALSEGQAQTLLAALSDLDSLNQQRLESLATISTSVLDHDIAETMLDFKDAAGQEKGSATLGSRMEFFEARVHEIRNSVEEMLAERQGVQSQIEDITDELAALLSDGTLEKAMDKAKECRETIDGTVDAAVTSWQEHESSYEQKKAMHSDLLLKMCSDLGDESRVILDGQEA